MSAIFYLEINKLILDCKFSRSNISTNETSKTFYSLWNLNYFSIFTKEKKLKSNIVFELTLET